MLVHAFFWVYFFFFGQESCSGFSWHDWNCPYPKAYVKFGGYKTCLDQCPHVNVWEHQSPIVCYCREDSNCEHLNAVCNKQTEMCQCLPDFNLIPLTGNCTSNRKIGEDCRLDEECKGYVCGYLDGKCCPFDHPSYPSCFPQQDLNNRCETQTDQECLSQNSVCVQKSCVCDETLFELDIDIPLRTRICVYENQVLTIPCNQSDFEKCTAGGIYSQCEYKVKSGEKVLQQCVYPFSELTKNERNAKPCNARDQFGVTWQAKNGFTEIKPCPFGNPSVNAYWSCKDGNFIGKTPNYDECSSVWLEDLEKIIEDKTDISFTDAINLSARIFQSISSENPNYYGHEVWRISIMIDNVVKKLLPTNLDCCNLTKNLATKIVGITNTLFKKELPWDQLQFVWGKRQTLSVVLNTLSEQTLETIQKGCFSIAESTCEWNQKPFRFPSNKVEVGSFKSTPGIFPSGGHNTAGRDTFIRFPAIDHTSNYIGAILENRYAVEYSRNDIANQKKSTYNDVHNDFEPNGDAVVFSISNEKNPQSHEVIKLKEPVVITTQHTKYSFGSEMKVIHRTLHPEEQPSAVMGSAECGYWDTKNSQWSPVGCTIVSKSAYSTVCSCNHLSTFSVLQKSHKYIGKSPVLVIMLTAIFCLIGFYLLFNIVAYLQPNEEDVERKNPIIKFSGLLLTLFSYVVIVFFVDKHFFPYGQVGCYRIGIISHFLILMFTFVMILESLRQTVDIACISILKFFLDLSRSYPNVFCLGVPFGMALIIVLTTVLWDTWDGPLSKAYGGEFCWLDGQFVYALYVPMWTAIACNYLIIGIVVRKCMNMVKEGIASSKSLRDEDVKIADITSFVKEGLTTNSLVFITWIVGFYSLGPNYLGYQFMGWVFPFLLFLQGYLIDKLLDKDKYVGKLKQKIINYLMRKFMKRDKSKKQTASSHNDNNSTENLPMIEKEKSEEERGHSNNANNYDPSKMGGVKVYPPFNINKRD